MKNKQNKTQIGANTVAKIKRYRDKMKTDTDKYEQMKKKGNKKNVKIKEKKNDKSMLKEMRRQKREQQRSYRTKQKAK